MTPRKVKAWRLRLDMTQGEFGTWLGVSRSTVNRWEGGTQAIPKMLGMLWDGQALIALSEAHVAKLMREERYTD